MESETATGTGIGTGIGTGTITFIVIFICIGLGIGLGLGLGLQKKKNNKKNTPVQVYGKMMTMNGIGGVAPEQSSWSYPLYTSEDDAKKMIGEGNYHTHTFENCNKIYYMSNSVTSHTGYPVQHPDYPVDTCDGNLPAEGNGNGNGGGSSSSSSNNSSGAFNGNF